MTHLTINHNNSYHYTINFSFFPLSSSREKTLHPMSSNSHTQKDTIMVICKSPLRPFPRFLFWGSSLCVFFLNVRFLWGDCYSRLEGQLYVKYNIRSEKGSIITPSGINSSFLPPLPSLCLSSFPHMSVFKKSKEEAAE